MRIIYAQNLYREGRVDLAALNRALKLVSSEVSGDIQAHTLRTFALVAAAGDSGITQQELESELGLSNAATSRNVSYWTYLRADKRPGPDFIRRHEDPMDRRTRILTLTEKGKAFHEKLAGG